MKLFGLTGAALALVLSVLQPTAASEEVCEAGEAGETCAAETHGTEASSLVQLARQGVALGGAEEGNLTASAQLNCKNHLGYIKVGKFIFENTCREDIVLKGWECVVPAGATCVVGHSCKGPPPTYKGKKLCSEVPAWFEQKRGITGLLWCLPNVKNSCSRLEMNLNFGGEGDCIQRTNGQMHIGFTQSWRAEIFHSGTTTPACRDYGMEQAVGDAHYSGGKWQCPGPSVPLGSPGIPKQCNTYGCYCKGQYNPTGCQITNPCKHVFDNMWTMIYDEKAKRSYKCKGACLAYNPTIPHGKEGCGWAAPHGIRADGLPEVSNYWYTDVNLRKHWAAGGIFGDWTTCKKLTAPVDFKVTSCNIARTPGADPACKCGSPEAPGMACPAKYPNGASLEDDAEGADAA